jgi:hypothetical protein
MCHHLRVGSLRGACALAACLFALAVVPAALAAPTAVGPRGILFVDGQPAFPIALLRPPPLAGTTPWGTSGLDEVVGAGVTILGTGPHGVEWTDAHLEDAKAWNDAAAARGVHTWVNLRELSLAQPGTTQEERLRAVVEALRDSPGLGLWKGSDEPWLGRWSPSLLAHAYATVKALDPAHLSVVIQAARGPAAELAPYSAVTDVHSVDVYPVRLRRVDPDLGAVGRWTRTLVGVTPNRAVLTTLQICHSGGFDRTGGTGAYVLPTRLQARYMAYDAILNGARGLVYFGGQLPGCMSPVDAPYGWNWTHWRDVLRPLVRELGPRGRLHAALLAGGAGIAVRSSDPGTRVTTRRVGREVWVLAARRGRGTVDVRLRGLPRALRSGWVYREGRKIRVRNGVLTDRFGRWDVHVYRFVTPAPR